MKNNLKYCVRIAHPDCFICKNAGIDASVWPQSNDVYGNWKFFLNSKDRPILSSGNKGSWFCDQHYALMYNWWVEVAQYEVDLDRLWHNYMDRIE